MFIYMGKIGIIILLFFLFTIPSYSQTCVEARYLKEVGVREKTGNNDGKDVEKYLKSVGLGKSYSYCAAFVHWVLESCGIPTSITAWSPTAENRNNLIYSKSKWNKTPKSGDVFTLYSSKMKRINHTGFLHRYNDGIVTTVEANTSSNGAISGSILDVNGDGVYMKKRSIHTIHSISRWTD